MMQQFSAEVTTAHKIAVETGSRLLAGKFAGRGGKTVHKKGELSLQSIETPEDRNAETFIYDELLKSFPRTKFLGEEKKIPAKFRRHLITSPGQINTADLVFGVDPVDGSSALTRNLPFYSHSIGVAENGQHLGGAIHMPAFFGGLTVWGERGRGVMVQQGSDAPRPAHVSRRKREEAALFLGCDFYVLRQFSGFLGNLHEIGSKVQVTASPISCAMMLALLACGRVEAVVQPAQMPWDWFAGYPLVEEAGGYFLFFHYRDGELVRMKKPDRDSYGQEQRSTSFIAANTRAMAEWLFKYIDRYWHLW